MKPDNYNEYRELDSDKTEKYERYGTYGIGDHISKEWFIYDRMEHRLCSGYKFKTLKEAQRTADRLNNIKIF